MIKYAGVAGAICSGTEEKQKRGESMADLNEDLNKLVNEGEDVTWRYDPEDIQKNKWICALSYVSILFFLPLVVCPDSKYGRFHANQALVLLIAGVAGEIVFGIAGTILGIISLGWIASIANALFSLLVFILMILGIVNVINGKAKHLPFVGKISLIK